MSAYRVGAHHGVTICREDDGYVCGRPDHDCARGHLVAVIINGDWELAERIAALLNASQRLTGPLVHETTEAIRKQLRILGYTEHTVECDGAMAAARAWTERQDAPESCLSASVSAQQPQTQGRLGVAGVAIESGRFDVWGEVTVDGGWLEMACNTCRAWSPDTADVADLAELVQRAAEHAEVCK